MDIVLLKLSKFKIETAGNYRTCKLKYTTVAELWGSILFGIDASFYSTYFSGGSNGTIYTYRNGETSANSISIELDKNNNFINLISYSQYSHWIVITTGQLNYAIRNIEWE